MRRAVRGTATLTVVWRPTQWVAVGRSKRGMVLGAWMQRARIGTINVWKSVVKDRRQEAWASSTDGLISLSEDWAREGYMSPVEVLIGLVKDWTKKPWVDRGDVLVSVVESRQQRA